VQYQAPLWRKLAGGHDLQVRVFFGCDMSIRGYYDEGFGSSVRWDLPLTEGYESEFLSTDPSIQRVGFRTPSGRGIGASMKRFEPDVVLLTAYNAMFHLRALLAARAMGAEVVMRHEASDSAVERTAVKSCVRDWILRRIYSRIGRFAAIGTNARQHLIRLGVKSERIGHSAYCVDTDLIGSQVNYWCAKREELRRGLGIADGEVVFVFSGKLVPKKDPLLIPSALRLLPEAERAQFHVIVAGDGELRAPFETELRGVIGERAHFFEFLNQSEIGRAYSMADYLILPSKRGAGETWGLVVNEAMQFGLPTIVSDAVGCHPDLVSDGATGWVFPAGSADALAAAMRNAARLHPVRKGEMARAAQERVAQFSLAEAADGLVKAIHSVRRA
jgi:glycosyltransferase involved in cell wall biosynthesis